MKWFEWVIAAVFICMGLLCLGLSGMPRLHADYMVFARTVIQICFWMSLPLLIIGLAYMVFKYFTK